MKIFTLLHNSNVVGTVLPGLKSRITSTRPVLALLLLLMVGGWTSVAWGGQAYVYAYSSPQTGGYVYVATSNSAPGSYSQNKASNSQGGFASSGNKTFYLFYKASVGYEFINWVKTDASHYNNATSITTSTDLTSQGQSVVQSATGIGAQNSYYAAVFKALPTYYFKATATTNNSTYGMAYVTFDESAKTTATSTEVTTNCYGTHYNTASMTKKAYFRAVPQTGYVFKGWSTTTSEDDIDITKTSASISVDLTSSSTNSASPALIRYYAIFGEKFAPQITGTASVNKKVGDSYTADFKFVNASLATPSSSSNADFYYTIKHELSSSVNNGTEVISYNPSTGTIQALNAGKATITFKNKLTSTHQAAEVSFVVNVTKKEPSFSCGTSMKVGQNLSCTYTNTSAATPTASSSDNFYYVFTENTPSGNTTGSDTPGAILTFSENKVYGKNAGTGTITFYQKETYMYKSANQAFQISVTKNDPAFTWNNNSTTYYHNTTIANVCSSSNKDFGFTIGTSTNELVARESGDTLYVLSKDGSAQFTVSQAENYKWNSKSQTFTVTPGKQSNHVPFTVNGTSTYEISKSSNTSWDSNGYKLGEGGVTNKECEVIIGFTGIPEYVTFTKHLDKIGLSLPAGSKAILYESADNSNWTEAWRNEERESDVSSGNVALKSTTRYLKFYYNGSIYCHYNNIKVTELKKFAANTDSLDFGEKEVNDKVSPMTFGLNYANVGHNVTLTTNDDHFIVSPTTITTIGGEKTGTFTPISVSYNTASVHTSSGAKLTIQDELGNKTTVNLNGKTVKHMPTVTWSSNAEYLNVDDVLRATNANGLTVTLSSTGNEAYVSCDGNAATMIEATEGTITITAHVTGNDIYADADFTKDITITNKEKQSITWGQDFSRLKTTDETKSITLNATASSGEPVSYTLVGDKTGLTLTQDGNTWTLTFTSECKNTTIVASQAGNGTYAPASSVSKTVKVIDPTKVCDDNEVLVNSRISLTAENLLTPASVTYNIDIPASMTVSFSRIKDKNALGWDVTYLLGVDVVFYSGRNGTGDELYTKSYSADDINKSLSNSNIDLTEYIHAKSVKITTSATNGYYIDTVSYAHRKYCEISKNSLSFNTYPNTQTVAQTFDVSYANYPISLECSNDKFSFTPAGFGDCSEYGTEQVSVTYTAGADKDSDVGYLYIKDNTGAALKTCTLSVTISKIDQLISSTTIQKSYLTTEKVTLSAEANSGLTDFTYSASPAGIASFNGAEMTFAQSGTIAITVSQAGTKVYNPTSTTVSDIVVSKATPDITAPAGTSIVYNQTLNKSTLSGGAAEITLRGVEHTSVAGGFAWKNPLQQVTDEAGEHNYSVIFTPTEGNMYNTKEFTIPINITRAEQTLTMNDGEIKLAVSTGIDAGAADSKIDLDDLINTQTVDLIEASRAGVVTYEVISANKEKAAIAEGNIFSAKEVGVYTIRATKAETKYYSQVTAEFTVTVGIRANTLATAGPYEKFVDEEVETAVATINSNGTIHTSSSDATIAYYDINDNKIVIPNSEAKSFDQKKVTLKIWQDATDSIEGISEANAKVITLTVKKYETSFGGKNYDLLVDDTQTGEYVFTNTSAKAPTANSEDDFYYAFENTTFANEALNKGGNELVSFNPATKLITAKNAGATKIAFYQKETRKHTGATATYWIVVSKHANEFSCVWNDESTEWTKLMDNNQNATVAITTNNKDYTHYPISVDLTYGEGIATLSGTASPYTITSTDEDGYAIWHLSQAEDYKYSSAEMDLTVAVGVPAPPTCYLVQDNVEHEFSTSIQLGVYDTPIAINAPADKIWFAAKRQLAGVNYFVAQYSVDGGISWRDICNPDLSTSYQDFGPYNFPDLQSNEFVTHIRFGAKTGATLSKWYKNVKVSRRSYINIQNAGHDKIASLAMPTNTVGDTTTAKFYIDYSTCDGELTIESSDSHFTVSRSTISVNGDNMDDAKEEVVVSYSSNAEGTHVGVITVRSSYQVAALSVSGVTNKRVQTIDWKEGFNTNPITLAVGTIVNDDNIAAVASSTNRVYYASSDASVIEIRNGGKEFAVVGEGTATLTVSAAGNTMWSDVSVNRTVVATEKQIQEISWEQIFPRFMEIGSQVDLGAKVYIRHGDERTYSAERSALVTYSCPLNNGIISVSGNKMTILKYGETTVTANVPGDENYETAAPMTVAVNVRQPSQGCPTPFVLDREGSVSINTNFSFSSYEYLESNSEILTLDKTIMGKPDKLSFQYEGEEYSVLGIPVLAGHVTAQQRIGGVWSNVNGSRVEPIKNEWKSIENLQLDERADAIRFYREAGGKGTHNFKDIKVTRKQYLTASVESINVGDIKMGQTKVVNVEFDYSDVKGDLTARAENTTNGLTIANNGAIDVECGSFGQYQLLVTIVPTQIGAWENTVYVKDNITNLEISVNLTANVLQADEKAIPIQNGVWDENTDMRNFGVNALATIPYVDRDTIFIRTDVTVKSLTVAEGLKAVIIEDGNVTVDSLKIPEGATVIVTSDDTLTINAGKEKNEKTGNLYVEDGGMLILADTAVLEVNNFTIEASIGTSDGKAKSGQVKNADRMNFANAYIEINMDPRGWMDDSKWYGFTVPFPVDVYEGVSRKEGNSYRRCVYGQHYMIAEYDADQRMRTGKGWKYITGNTLEPGKFYYFGANGRWNTYRFKAEGTTYTQPDAVLLVMNGTGADANWNAVGNSLLQHVTVNYESVNEYKYVQVYQNGLDAYLAVEVSEAAFVVGCPFFIQATVESELTLSVSSSASAHYAPRRTQAQGGVSRINLTPNDGGYSDQIYVSGADKEQNGYVMGHDLSKAGVSKEVSQLWVNNYGQKLSVNEAAWQGNKAICPLGMYVPENGEYVLTATQPEDGLEVYLTKDGSIIWNLTMSECVLSLNKGTDASYGLVIVKAPEITTDTENIGAHESEHVQKIILDDHVYILRNGEMFDATGRKVR